MSVILTKRISRDGPREWPEPKAEIEGNRIVWVGRAVDAKIPKDATVVDTSGRTMLPGLMDLHAHLMILGHGNYDRWFPWSGSPAAGAEIP